MKKNITAVSVLVLLSLVLGACNLSSAAETQVPADQINTIAAMTVEALTTQMAPPPATATNTLEPTVPVTETPTQLIPTLNLTPLTLATNTLIPLPTSAGVGSTECNKVFFLKDETIPDGTVFKPETNFIKTWSIQNSGSCTWTSLYMASVFSNDPTDPIITGDETIPVKVNVAPGAIWKYSANLWAPKPVGTYTQYWKMIDDAGNYFGIGGPSGPGWYLKIEVSKSGTSSSSSGLKIASTASASPDSGHVGDTITVSGKVTLSGLAKDDTQLVNFEVRMGGSSMGCGDSYTFNDNGDYSYSLSDCKVPDLSGGEKSVQVYINSPGGTNAATADTFTIN